MHRKMDYLNDMDKKAPKKSIFLNLLCIPAGIITGYIGGHTLVFVYENIYHLKKILFP